MSDALTVSQTTELVAALKAAVQDCALAEEKLVKDFQTQLEAQEKRRRDTLTSLEAKLTTDLQQAESRLITHSDAVRTQYRRWTALISKAHKRAHQQSLRWIEEEEGRRKYPVQKGLLDTKRWRAESLEQNDARWADVQRQVADNQETFTGLEAAAHRAFRGYRRFRKYLNAPAGGSDLRGDEYEMLSELGQLEERTSAQLQRFRRCVCPSVFRRVPLIHWFVLLAALGALAPFMLPYLGVAAIPWQYSAAVAGGVFFLILTVYFTGQQQTKSLAWGISSALGRAARLREACLQQGHARHSSEIERIGTEAAKRAADSVGDRLHR